MLKKFSSFIFPLIVLFSTGVHADRIDLNQYLGTYQISIFERFQSRPIMDQVRGAAILKDSIHIRSLNESFERFAFRPVPNDPMTSVTVYKSLRDGHLYSYERDANHVRSEDEFEDSVYREGLFDGTIWIRLEETKNELRGTFYPNSIRDRVSISIRFLPNRVEYISRGLSLWGIPLKRTEIFERSTQ